MKDGSMKTLIDSVLVFVDHKSKLVDRFSELSKLVHDLTILVERQTFNILELIRKSLQLQLELLVTLG